MMPRIRYAEEWLNISHWIAVKIDDVEDRVSLNLCFAWRSVRERHIRQPTAATWLFHIPENAQATQGEAEAEADQCVAILRGNRAWENSL
jgi:hypothetical protein